MGCRSSIPTMNSSSHHDNAKPNESSNVIEKRNRVTDSNQITQNFLLIILDAQCDKSADDFSKSIKHLKKLVNTIEVFDDDNECIDYITQIENEKAFFIISGALCQSVIPRIHHLDQLYSIHICCCQPSIYEEWTKDWPKVKSIVTELNSICDSVQQLARQCDEDSVTISAIKSLNQIESSFMYTQLFKEVILEINFDKEKEIQALVQYVRKKYEGNDNQLKIIDEFATEYRDDSDGKNRPIWWYTRECFTYSMLNKALGILQVDTLLKMGIFMRDLHENIVNLHAKQLNAVSDDSTQTLTVYRGKTMPKEDFETKIKQDGLMSFNNFLSTSDNRNVALEFLSKGLKSGDSNKVGVLFEMAVDRKTSTTPFARIDGISFFPTENEILFTTHTVFRIQQVEQIEINHIKINIVKLRLTSENDSQQFNTLKQHLRDEISGTGWQQMGYLLWKLGENEKAEQVYTLLLQDESLSDKDRSYCYNQLGLIKDGEGEYSKAIEFYETSLDIRQKCVSENHSDLATSWNNIGMAYSHMGEYLKALEFYEKSLHIYEKTLPENHLDLAGSYNNIASLNYKMGEYQEAHKFYEKALNIYKKTLPENHPDLATIYNNIGMVNHNMGDYVTALEFHKKALDIRKEALPESHPDVASSYNNIAMVYSSIEEYTMAVEFYEKSLNIRQKILPANHPELANSYNNIGMVYSNMDEYTKALEFYEKSLDIFEKLFPSSQPSLATTCNNIASLHYRMGEYLKAIEFYEKSLGIFEKILPSNHPSLATSYNNIASVYFGMREHQKALESYEKSLDIRQKILPENHPVFATSFNNIAAVYDDMGQYSKALEFYEKSLHISELTLPPTHPHIVLTKSNIEVVKQKM